MSLKSSFLAGVVFLLFCLSKGLDALPFVVFPTPFRENGISDYPAHGPVIETIRYLLCSPAAFISEKRADAS